jgi:hypothetical protein
VLTSGTHLADVAHKGRGRALRLQARELHHVGRVVRAHRLFARLLAQRDPPVLGQCPRCVRLLRAQFAEMGAAHGAVEYSLAVLLTALVTRH